MKNKGYCNPETFEIKRNDLNQLVKGIFENSGLTMDKFAEKSGLSCKQDVYNIITNRTKLGFNRFEKICNANNVKFLITIEQ